MNLSLKRAAAALLVLLIAVTAFGAGISAQAQSSSETLVRFVHAIPGASAVDIYADGALLVSALEFGEASLHLRINAGDHQLSVTQAGVTTVLWQQNISLTAGTAQTLIASSTNPLGFQPFTDDLSPLPLGKARFTAIHAIAGGPAVDVLLSDGRPVIAGLTYNQPYGTFDLQSASYDLVVVPSGETIDGALLPAAPFALDSGGVYSLLVYGTAANPQTKLLTTAALPEAGSSFVRVVHSVPGAPPVDVYLDEVLIAPALAFGANATDYIPVTPGAHTIGARPVGGDRNVVEIPIDATPDQRTTVAILRGEGGSGLLLPMTEASISAAPEDALLDVINVLPTESTATLTGADGSVLADDITSGALTRVALNPAAGAPTLSVTIGGSTTELPVEISTLYAGVAYSALVVEGDNGVEIVSLNPSGFGQAVAAAPVTVAESTASADATEAAVAAAPTEVAPLTTPEAAAPTEVAPVQPTTAPEIQPVAEVTEVVAEVPTEAPAVTLVAGTPDPTANLPRGRVLLDPGVNLQLRQLPDRNALSLGLVPSGEQLIINGRTAGAIDQGTSIQSNNDGNAIFGSQATDEPIITPLSNEIWLYITYNTPDGGTINAWVNSEYIDVRSPSNEPVKVADLPIIPGSIIGEARDTSITPPPVVRNTGVTLVVGNMNEGVNLNIRRTQSTDGEVLVQVPKGTVLQYLGISDDGRWAFVRYEPPQVNSVTGWVNAQYIESILYEGAEITEEELAEKKLLVIIPDSERGGVGVVTGGGTSELPTVETADRNTIVGQVYSLNPGVNLQLRRSPDSLAESLALLPNGTELVVNGRSENGSWLEVTYEGQNGWVSSQYVQLTFRGKEYQLEEVPVFEAGTAEPGGVNFLGATQAAPDAAATQIILPTPTPARVMVVTRFVSMTTEPGGSSEGLPSLSATDEVFYLGGDPNTGYVWVQTKDGKQGWVQSNAVQFK